MELAQIDTSSGYIRTCPATDRRCSTFEEDGLRMSLRDRFGADGYPCGVETLSNGDAILLCQQKGRLAMSEIETPVDVERTHNA